MHRVLLTSCVVLSLGACSRDGASERLDAGGDLSANASLDAASDGAGLQMDSGADGAVPALPTGTVTLKAPPASCPVAGAVCTALSVSGCPGIPDIDVMLAVSEPTGASQGTVFMIYGGGGDVFFTTASGGAANFLPEYLTGNLRVAQVRFASAWQAANGAGLKAAACRPATLVQWVYQNVHVGNVKNTANAAFCAHGHSGGSGALGFVLAHYGKKSILDYAMFDAGPVFGKVVAGCEPGPKTRFVCPEIPNGVYSYAGARTAIDSWEGTSSCGATANLPADVTRWASDGVVSTGADYNYPQTETSFWYCSNNSNEAAGQGSFFVEKVASTKSVHCLGGACAVEPPWLNDSGNQAMMVSAMISGCVLRH